MRAIAGGDAFGTKYFIVMDRLYDTMDKRILKWEKSLKKYTGKLTSKLTDRDGSKAAALLEERLVAAYDLCAAICYLHSRKIIYRDIKVSVLTEDERERDTTFPSLSGFIYISLTPTSKIFSRTTLDSIFVKMWNYLISVLPKSLHVMLRQSEMALTNSLKGPEVSDTCKYWSPLYYWLHTSTPTCVLPCPRFAKINLTIFCF